MKNISLFSGVAYAMLFVNLNEKLAKRNGKISKNTEKKLKKRKKKRIKRKINEKIVKNKKNIPVKIYLLWESK